ncbi:cellulose synthase-like protein E6 [Tanacetum coccineum]
MLGLVCLWLSYGLPSTGSLLSWFLESCYTSTFKTRLSKRSADFSTDKYYILFLIYSSTGGRYEKVLPGVDIFVCTADTLIEPPIMVINTVLSAMAYDYPPEKLHIYVSDDGGSELMFYALLQASRFSKYWLPFCKKYKIEPRSPAAYIATLPHKSSPIANECISLIKDKYEEMTKRIENTMRLGKLTQELRNEHKGFQEWDAGSNKHDHQAIILIDQRDFEAVDTEGKTLPSLIYMAREKRPKWHHNFKAGAMNALLGVKYGCPMEDVITGLTIKTFKYFYPTTAPWYTGGGGSH